MGTKKIRFTTDELNRRIFSAIMQYQPTKDRRMSKEIISLRVYGYYDPSTDRSIRDAVTELVIQGHPICATSDVPGYFIARSYQEAEQCIKELRSRADIFSLKIEGIKRGLMHKNAHVNEPTQIQLI